MGMKRLSSNSTSNSSSTTLRTMICPIWNPRSPSTSLTSSSQSSNNSSNPPSSSNQWGSKPCGNRANRIHLNQPNNHRRTSIPQEFLDPRTLLSSLTTIPIERKFHRTLAKLLRLKTQGMLHSRTFTNSHNHRIFLSMELNVNPLPVVSPGIPLSQERVYTDNHHRLKMWMHMSKVRTLPSTQTSRKRKPRWPSS